MPRINVKVLDSKEVWRSPDGQRVITALRLDVDGQEVTAKTYSKNFNTGWSGEVETYEKEGRNGPETFVKQPPKEGGYSGNSGGGKNYAPKDEKAIQAMWAIGQAVALIGPAADAAPEQVGVVQSIATQLFAMVDVVKAGEQSAADKEAEGFKKDIANIFGTEEDADPWQPN